ALYLRDEEGGAFWSALPGPAPYGGGYEVRHGFGYTRFLHATGGLEQETRVFVPREDPVRIARLRITNRGTTPRQLSLYGYAQLVLGGLAADTRVNIVTEHDSATDAIFARNPRRAEFSERVAFAASVASPAGERFVTADRVAFLGEDGAPDRPAAVVSGVPLDAVAGAGLDPCAALQHRTRLEPGETITCAFLLGEAANAGATRALLARYRTVEAVDRAYDDAVSAWRALLSAVRIETPSPALDLMVNGWLAYQNLSCRMWGRTAFYQSGGAFGFRDQLQDSAALLYHDPGITRAQILLHAAHQFVEGDVLHWWHPPTGKGIRTRFSDDLLWLPYVTSFYVRSTGDAALLDETVPFVEARLLEPGDDEVFLVPDRTAGVATVYEHCCRSIDRSLTSGAHGLPLMGVGDWNDGMNRVGREGRGESVWLGFFLYDILGDFIPLCATRGESDRADRYARYREELYASLNDSGWDGAWYRRAYYDDGTTLGSAANDECRIDALAQAWAVLSGVAPAGRAAQAVHALEEHLVSDDDGIIRLLTPAFDRTSHDPGYIKGYLPGVRENGGQYTHAALWAVRALAEHGEAERAAPLLEMLSPVTQARTPEEVAVYRTEPYVIAADVYGEEPHIGRGGWTWYTGSAGWMVRVALESILGITVSGGDVLRLRPCIPGAWPGFRVELRLPDGRTRYRIAVERDRAAATLARADGVPLTVRDGAVLIPLVRDGGTHAVSVVLGDDVGPLYRPRPPSSSAAPFVRMTSE
ncbi:MAG: GH36-type glycosyl hydrolase domain-containing protein, partial [Longimicrobiales bacterium]